MEWTASTPVAATSHVSAPKPPNDPKHSNDDERDVPMGETTEETKQKKQPGTQKTHTQDRNKENRVHWGENVVHNLGNNKNDDKHNKGDKESQQEMVWRPKVTTGMTTAATTNALAVETTGVTEAPKPTKQGNATSKGKATERTTTTTATPPTQKKATTTTATALGPKKTAATGTPEKKGQQTKQQQQVAQRGSKQQTQNTTGSQSHDRENLANATPNSERRNVNRRLTKVRTDWEEFKLLSFNVRGLNSESKQKVVDELVRRNRP
jgi:hypothetical protein